MGFFSPSSGSSSRHHHGSDSHKSGHRSSGHRHDKSSSGHTSSSHRTSGSGSSSSSSRASRTSGRERKRSSHESSASPPTSSATVDDDGSVAGATPTTEATEYCEEEEKEEEEDDSSDNEDDSEEDENAGSTQDDGFALDYDDGGGDGDDSGSTDRDSDPGHAGHAALSQQVRAHVFENGLRYHAFTGPATAARPGGGKRYALPNDEVEQNRDDMKHAVTVQLMRGQLFYAPVQARLAAGAAVFDLGTGTGIWAMEVGDKYPKSVVHGVDLSPIQPNYVPRNVYFVVDDFEDDWDAPAAAFDFVHMRHTLWAVDDRPALLRRIFHHLKPGGYVEFQEFVPEVCFEEEDEAVGRGGGSSSSSHHSHRGSSHRTSGSGSSSSSSSSKHRHHHHPPPEPAKPHAYRDFLQYIGMGMQQSQLLAGGDLFGPGWAAGDAGDDAPPPAAAACLERALAADLAAAGFRSARTAVHKAPLGDWGGSSAKPSKRLRCHGALLQRAVLDGLRGWAARPLGTAAGGLGWTPTQIEIYLVYVRKALADPAARAYLPLHVTYAQKPE